MTDMLVYAGFWRRFAATILDTFILAMPITAIVILLAGNLLDTPPPPTDMASIMQEANRKAEATYSPLDTKRLQQLILKKTRGTETESEMPPWVNLLSCVVLIMTTILLTASRRMQATPGKWLLNMRIIDAETGHAISKGQAALRYVGYVASSLVLCLGYVMVAFTRQKTGLHDLIARTRVVIGRVPLREQRGRGDEVHTITNGAAD